MLLKLVSAGRLDPSSLITHSGFSWKSYLPKLTYHIGFAFADMEAAYSTFSAASEHKALKVLIDF